MTDLVSAAMERFGQNSPELLRSTGDSGVQYVYSSGTGTFANGGCSNIVTQQNQTTSANKISVGIDCYDFVHHVLLVVVYGVVVCSRSSLNLSISCIYALEDGAQMSFGSCSSNPVAWVVL